MSRTRAARRPADPMEIALRRQEARARERDPTTWGVDPAALALPANADVARGPTVGGRVTRAHRLDVFDLMRTRGRLSAAAVDAVRRLQADIARLHQFGASQTHYGPRIDSSRRPAEFGEARRKAGARIEAVLVLAGPASARLISALCEPDVVLGRSADWRNVVARETGETLPDGQGALLRMACENLAQAYGALDNGRVIGGAHPASRLLRG